MSEPTESSFEDNKDSSAAQPVENAPSEDIQPANDGVPVDDKAERKNANVQHLANPEDVEAQE